MGRKAPSGPRRALYFDPAVTRAGVVTCGGLCPGLNDVIRGIVIELTEHTPIADYPTLLAGIERLGEISMAVDDAGAGYAVVRNGNGQRGNGGGARGKLSEVAAGKNTGGSG